MKFFVGCVFLLSGCATLFGWNIHAPGILSDKFYEDIHTVPARMALYIPPHLTQFTSQDRGGTLADPQTYYIGESFAPMLLESFQQGFSEFVFMEVDPSADVLKQYDIPNIVVVDIREFHNKVTLKGQAESVVTEVWIMNNDLQVVRHLEVIETSDAQKVFAKKGGPEVNMNAAIEQNVRLTVAYLQDFLKEGQAL
ncbi:MAG: hypothetical protein JW938_04285 [Candidatus Omnitrophica bacterium]|nr:hypothetical protein [Candidatus Omnitrophota bacterium]